TAGSVGRNRGGANTCFSPDERESSHGADATRSWGGGSVLRGSPPSAARGFPGGRARANRRRIHRPAGVGDRIGLARRARNHGIDPRHHDARSRDGIGEFIAANASEPQPPRGPQSKPDRKSTRLNSSHT